MPTNDYLRPVWQTMYTRPGSAIYEAKATDKFKGKKLIIASVPVFQALLMWNICNLNVACKNPQFPTQHQFEMMAEALAHGLVHLLETPLQDLIDMENPYSFQARLSTGVEEQIMYDVAYYERNYYVYFGVGPIILFYLPYFLITGSHIPTYVLVWIIGILVAGGWLFLSYELIKKYFRDFSFALYLVCSFLFSAGCGLTYVVSRPDFYAIPMTMGLVCSLYGLGCWLKSIEDEKITPIWVCLGSFSMAFVAACRPQFY